MSLLRNRRSDRPGTRLSGVLRGRSGATHHCRAWVSWVTVTGRTCNVRYASSKVRTRSAGRRHIVGYDATPTQAQDAKSIEGPAPRSPL